MPISNNRKTNISRTVENKNKVKDEVKKLAKEKIAEQLGLDKNLKKTDDQKMSPENRQYQLAATRNVEQAKLAIRNIKELEGQSKEVQIQEAQMKAKEDIDRETARANREIERQMKAQGKELSRRERMVMGAMEKSAGKVSVAAATKTAGKMSEMVKQGNSVEVGAVFLFSLVLAAAKDILDWAINLLDLTGIGVIAVVILCFILSLTVGLTITIFMMSVSPHGMIGKRIMRRVARYFATIIIDSIAVINILPTMTIYVLWEWFSIKRETKKAEADLKKFKKDLKKGRVNKKTLEQYG